MDQISLEPQRVDVVRHLVANRWSCSSLDALKEVTG